MFFLRYFARFSRWGYYIENRPKEGLKNERLCWLRCWWAPLNTQGICFSQERRWVWKEVHETMPFSLDLARVRSPASPGMIFSQYINYDSRHCTINLLNAIRLNLFCGFSQKIRVIPRHYYAIPLNYTVTLPSSWSMHTCRKQRACDVAYILFSCFSFIPIRRTPAHFFTFNRIATRRYTNKITGRYVDKRAPGDKSLPGNTFARFSINLMDQ